MDCGEIMSQPNIQCPNGCGKLRADLREDDECIWRDMVCDGCGYVFGLESIPNPKAFKWTERNMQDALTARGNLFDWTRYAVIPNVTAFSVFEHGEADLLCLSKSNTLHEVEIKVSASDLMADSKKGPYAHHNRLVSYVWFAVPESLIPVALSNLDERFGIVAVHHKIYSSRELFSRVHTKVIRRPKKNNMQWHRKPNGDEVVRLLRTGVNRMWSRRTGVET